MMRVLGAMLFMLALGAVARAADAPSTQPAAASTQPIDIAVRDVLWQVLPERVHRVTVGPDGRVWYTLSAASDGRAAPRIDILKEVAEREFAGPAPQLVHLRPVLFEKSGRVWFTGPSDESLHGWDGKTWIDHAPSSKNIRYLGSCPNHGAAVGAGANRQLSDHLFFVANYGVDCFDGQSWTFIDTGSGSSWEYAPILLPLPDDAGLVLVARSGKAPVLRQFSDGKWADLPEPWLPPNSAEPFRRIGAAALGPDNRVWMMTIAAVVTSQAVNDVPTSTRPALDLSASIAQLGADSFDDREKATAALAALGAKAAPSLRAALATATDPEIKTRLQSILDQMQGKPLDTMKGGEPRGIDIAGAQLDQLHGMVNAADGTMLIAGEEPRDGQPAAMTTAWRGPNLLLARPEGKLVVQDADVRDCIGFPNYARAPVLTRGGKAMWLSNYNGRPALLLDLATGKIVDRVIDPGFNYVLAALDDGTVFLLTNDPPWSSGAVAVYKPGKPDDRKVVKAATTPLMSQTFAVASDGSVWARVTDKGIARFDGQSWRPAGLMHAMNESLTVGDGAVLLYSPQATTVVIDGKESDIGEPRAVIQQHRKEIIAAFGPGKIQSAPEGGQPLAVDKDGNIWLAAPDRVAVLVGDHWLEPDEGKPPTLMEAVRSVAAVGDGSAVYLDNFDANPSRAIGRLGRIVDGKAKFDDAPHRVSGPANGRNLVDKDGGLWIATEDSKPMGPNGWSTSGSGVARITEKGVDVSLPHAGQPWLIDAAGNVWLTGAGHAAGEYSIVNNGKESAKFQLGERLGTSMLVTDDAGNFYTWTATGLHHYTANDPRDPAAGFTLRDSFILHDEHDRLIPGPTGGVLPRYSAKAGLVCLASSPDGVVLVTVPLPK